MIRTFFAIALFVVFYFLYGFYLSSFDVNVLPPQIQRQHPYPYFDYKGVTNVYSNLSLGSGDYREIVADAKAASLDFLFITDLNIFENLLLPEGYNGTLLVLFAGKYSYLDSRLLYYSMANRLEGQSLGSAHIHITDQLSQATNSGSNTSFVLTHPFLKGFGWSGEFPVGLDGIELINFKRVQQKHWEDSKADSFFSLMMYPFNPELAFVRLLDDPNEESNLLDDLQKKRPTTLHLGLEATAKAIPFTGSTIHFPSYETLFGLGSMHLLLRSELTGKINSDKLKILKAIKEQEFYISLDVMGNPKGFNAVIKDKEETYLMGSKIKFRKNLNLFYQVPKPKTPFEIVVFKDGQTLHAFQENNEGSVPITEKGVYRILVKLRLSLPIPMKPRWIPWIYTNSFYIE
jgi:hypothetical protein